MARPEQNRAGLRLLFVAMLVVGGGYLGAGMISSMIITGPGLVNAFGKPIGRDFVTFYAASAMALDGEATATYDMAAIHAEEKMLIGAPFEPLAWHYPPPGLLLVLPLALLPYLLALTLWLAVQFGSLAALLRVIAPPLALLGLVAPATAQSMISGQNGLLSASLIGGGLLMLERRPGLAGAILGLLVYKPQIGVLILPALIAGGQWRAIAAMAASAAGFSALGLMVFGLDPWLAFFRNMSFVRELVEHGRLPLSRFPTVFVGLRLAGASLALAYGCQAASALVALVMVVAAWRRQGPFGLKAAVLLLATPLATPYAFDYDLTILLPALAWLAALGLAQGFRWGEIVMLPALWLMPVATWLLAEWTGVQVGPVILALGLVAVWARLVRPGTGHESALPTAGEDHRLPVAGTGRSSVR